MNVAASNADQGVASSAAVEVILQRISPGKLAEPAPPAAVVDELLRAAVRAPDHGRLQPWRFIVVEGDARVRLGDLFATTLHRREPDSALQKLEAERAKPMRAPLVIIVAAEAREHPTIPEIEQVMAVAAAAQNMLLAAHARGFGGFWRTGASAYDPEVKRALGLATGSHIVGFLYLGTIAFPGRPRSDDPAPFVRRWPQASV
jgi:nitroreductase